MYNDPRARFVIAQQLIEEGRKEEARLLLRSLEQVPAAQEWADRLEQGEEVDPDELIWEPGMAQPQRPPLPITLPQFKPARFVMSLFLALMLLAPFLQMFTLSGAVYPSQNAALRGEARTRVQLLCNVLVNRAIAEGRLEREFGSCSEWSLRLGDDQFLEVIQCHSQAGPDAPAFERCIIEADLFPDDLTNFGQSL